MGWNFDTSFARSLQAEDVAPLPAAVNARQRKAAEKHRKAADRPFVVWDGEGVRGPTGRSPQRFCLFGAYDGVDHHKVVAPELSTGECLRLILDVKDANPDAIHVGYAFEYDVNMILSELSARHFVKLRDKGKVFWRHYIIRHVPRKWFMVTTRQRQREGKPWARIFDVFGFWQSSFLTAINTTIPHHPLMTRLNEVEAGKSKRKDFRYQHIEFITSYWEIENELLFALVHRLREMLHDVGIYLSSWHGPGAVASAVYKSNGIREHKSDCGERIYDAARFAYAGGRFECFKVGRVERVWSYDINSAYPNAIAKLPSLSEGRWIYRRNPTEISEFGVYHIRMNPDSFDVVKRGLFYRPAPFFYRTPTGNMLYPWQVEGWQWAPEVSAYLAHRRDDEPELEIIEGWEYVGWETRPFSFVETMFEQRRVLKAAGDGAQMAIKLALNSLYGKMAQRAGWREDDPVNSIPSWHQLEWAGWVTSYTRAMIWTAIHSIHFGKVVAVETDGIYTTAPPEEIGLTNGKNLGEWEVNYYDEMIYLQSGMYAKRSGDEWSVKFRGLDKDSFGDTPDVIAKVFADHARSMTPDNKWKPISGKTTRFTAYVHALFMGEQKHCDMKAFHCVWSVEDREISVKGGGKRSHAKRICPQCQAGRTAYEEAHWTASITNAEVVHTISDEDWTRVMGSSFKMPKERPMMSARHYIPWLNDVPVPDWYADEEKERGLIRV